MIYFSRRTWGCGIFFTLFFFPTASNKKNTARLTNYCIALRKAFPMFIFGCTYVCKFFFFIFQYLVKMCLIKKHFGQRSSMFWQNYVENSQNKHVFCIFFAFFSVLVFWFALRLMDLNPLYCCVLPNTTLHQYKLFHVFHHGMGQWFGPPFFDCICVDYFAEVIHHRVYRFTTTVLCCIIVHGLKKKVRIINQSFICENQFTICFWFLE